MDCPKLETLAKALNMEVGELTVLLPTIDIENITEEFIEKLKPIPVSFSDFESIAEEKLKSLIC